MTTRLFTFPDPAVLHQGGAKSVMDFNTGSPQPRFRITSPVALAPSDQVRFYGNASNFGSFGNPVNAVVPSGVLSALCTADGAFDLTLTVNTAGTLLMLISPSGCPVHIDSLTIDLL